MAVGEREHRVGPADRVEVRARRLGAGAADRQVAERDPGPAVEVRVRAGARPAERDRVRDQRMHAVDGHEFLGQRVADPVVVRARAGDAAQHLARPDPPDALAERLFQHSPPRGPDRPLGRRMRDHRGRPLDGVDLRHERGVDQPRLLEQGLALQRLRCLERIADRIVLPREQVVEQGEAEPEVRHRHRPQVRRPLDLLQQLIADLDPAVVGPQAMHELRMDAVELRCVPPVGLVAHEARGAGSRPVRLCEGSVPPDCGRCCIQSCTSNCSQAAASRFSDPASMKVPSVGSAARRQRPSRSEDSSAPGTPARCGRSAIPWPPSRGRRGRCRFPGCACRHACRVHRTLRRVDGRRVVEVEPPELVAQAVEREPPRRGGLESQPPLRSARSA